LYRYPLRERGYGATTQWTRECASAADWPLQLFVAGVDYYATEQVQRRSIDFSDPSAYMPLDVFHPKYGTPFPPIFPYTRRDPCTLRRTVSPGRMQLTKTAFLLTAGGRLDFASNRDLSQPESNDISLLTASGRELPHRAERCSLCEHSSLFFHNREECTTAHQRAFVRPETGDPVGGDEKLPAFCRM